MLEIESKLRSESLEQANRHTCKLLLNCYIRELAQEREDDIALNADTLDYAVAFPVCGVTVFGKLAYYSAAGEHEYESIRRSGANGANGHVEYGELVQWIIRELSSEGLGTGEGAPADDNRITDEQARSFAEKVDNSCRNLALFIERAAELEVFDYRTSEQSLIYGHPFHPFPKNSRGFSERDVRMFSPELRTSFRLGYFAVRKDVF
ncbi:IucA/IucC family protein, partial [Paenibacillus macerans]